MTAAVTPRVRATIICDQIEASFADHAVCDLEAVRQEIAAETFPFTPHSLFLFLWLTSPVVGRFLCIITILESRNDKAVFYSTVEFFFDTAHTYVPGRTQFSCTFPSPGQYTIQVLFYQEDGSDVLKAVLPFSIEDAGV